MHLSSPEDSEPDPENWNRFSDGANARRLPKIMLKQSEIMIRLIVIQRWAQTNRLPFVPVEQTTAPRIESRTGDASMVQRKPHPPHDSCLSAQWRDLAAMLCSALHRPRRIPGKRVKLSAKIRMAKEHPDFHEVDWYDRRRKQCARSSSRLLQPLSL
jgi:hypothetical protein